MGKGYCGKILRVDLSNEVITDEPLDMKLAEKFVGQAGLAAKMLFDEVPPQIAPLDPQNRLIFMTGPFTGTTVPCASRYEAVFKSPVTNGYGEANVGGHWGAQLKWAGYDGVIVQGRAKSPKVLVITSDGASLKDASHLWGKYTYETEELLKKELGSEKFKFVSIGPAGENLVPVAAIMTTGRAAARTGSGAVMGSKKLKAIAVKGTKRPEVADPDRVRELNRKFSKLLKELPGPRGMSANGTIGNFLRYAGIGYGLVKNWQEALSEWPGKDKISGTVLNEQYLVAKDACFACPVGCGRIVRDPLGGSPIKGPEYETTGMLGAQICLWDMDGLILANHLCNNLGLDTISVGAILAFAMECYERGLIPANILQGQKIPWGDRDIILKLTEDMAYKRGRLGELLASGVKHMAEVLGNNTSDFAVHVRGVEIAAHDPRVSQGWGLGYAVGSTGGRHTEHAPWPEFLSLPIPKIGLKDTIDPKGIKGIPAEIRTIQNCINLMNSAGCCYPIYGPTDSMDYARDYLEAVTGYKRDIEELLRCGERGFNVKRAFNARVGIGRKDDVLPKRFTRDALKAGASKGYVARTAEMLDEYYQVRGWDPKTGWPTKKKLEELSLSDVSKALYG